MSPKPCVFVWLGDSWLREYARRMSNGSPRVSVPSRSRSLWLSVLLSTLGAACLPTDAELGRTRPQRETTTKVASSVKTTATAKAPASPKPPPPPVAPDPPLGTEFSDDFERTTVGPQWRVMSGRWHIDAGKLCVSGARNKPAWLKRRLPTNAVVEFDATSASPDGDIKAEFWGDGRSSATSVSYNNATSYLTIWGGWKNRYHVLARIDEHAKSRRELMVDATSSDFNRKPVEPNRTYRFRVERRDGKTVQWSVDGQPILTYPDAEPLVGAGHEHFGFNNWEVPVCFDNLSVKALP